MKSACKESCRSSNKELRSIDFTSLLFLKTKEKENEILHLGPWNDLGARGYAPGQSQEQRRRRRSGSRRVSSPAARGKWGKG